MFVSRPRPDRACTRVAPSPRRRRRRRRRRRARATRPPDVHQHARVHRAVAKTFEVFDDARAGDVQIPRAAVFRQPTVLGVHAGAEIRRRVLPNARVPRQSIVRRRRTAPRSPPRGSTQRPRRARAEAEAEAEATRSRRGIRRGSLDASVSFSGSEFSGGVHFATTASCAARPSAVRTAACHGAFAATMGRAASAAFRLAKSGGSFRVNARAAFSNLRARQRVSSLAPSAASLIGLARSHAAPPPPTPRVPLRCVFPRGVRVRRRTPPRRRRFRARRRASLPPVRVRRAPPTRAGRETPAGNARRVNERAYRRLRAFRQRLRVTGGERGVDGDEKRAESFHACASSPRAVRASIPRRRRPRQFSTRRARADPPPPSRPRRRRATRAPPDSNSAPSGYRREIPVSKSARVGFGAPARGRARQRVTRRRRRASSTRPSTPRATPTSNARLAARAMVVVRAFPDSASVSKHCAIAATIARGRDADAKPGATQLANRSAASCASVASSARHASSAASTSRFPTSRRNVSSEARSECARLCAVTGSSPPSDFFSRRERHLGGDEHRATRRTRYRRNRGVDDGDAKFSRRRRVRGPRRVRAFRLDESTAHRPGRATRHVDAPEPRRAPPRGWTTTSSSGWTARRRRRASARPRRRREVRRPRRTPRRRERVRHVRGQTADGDERTVPFAGNFTPAIETRRCARRGRRRTPTVCKRRRTSPREGAVARERASEDASGPAGRSISPSMRRSESKATGRQRSRF